MPLVDGIDEPFGGIDFLLHELHGFLSAAGVLAVGKLFQHLEVLLADVQLGGVASVQRKLHLAVSDKDEKVGRDVVDVLRAAAGGVGGLGVEFQDFVQRGFQLAVADF